MVVALVNCPIALVLVGLEARFEGFEVLGADGDLPIVLIHESLQMWALFVCDEVLLARRVLIEVRCEVQRS